MHGQGSFAQVPRSRSGRHPFAYDAAPPIAIDSSCEGTSSAEERANMGRFVVRRSSALHRGIMRALYVADKERAVLRRMVGTINVARG